MRKKCDFGDFKQIGIRENAVRVIRAERSLPVSAALFRMQDSSRYGRKFSFFESPSYLFRVADLWPVNNRLIA